MVIRRPSSGRRVRALRSSFLWRHLVSYSQADLSEAQQVAHTPSQTERPAVSIRGRPLEAAGMAAGMAMGVGRPAARRSRVINYNQQTGRQYGTSVSPRCSGVRTHALSPPFSDLLTIARVNHHLQLHLLSVPPPVKHSRIALAPVVAASAVRRAAGAAASALLAVLARGGTHGGAGGDLALAPVVAASAVRRAAGAAASAAHVRAVARGVARDIGQRHAVRGTRERHESHHRHDEREKDQCDPHERSFTNLDCAQSGFTEGHPTGHLRSL